MDKWHQIGVEDIYRELKSGPGGLSAVEAVNRLSAYGRNELAETKRRSLLAMFIDQFRDFMILILIAAAIISGIIGEAIDTIAIAVIVTLNAVIGLVQEYRAEKAMIALKKMATQMATVLRDGKMSTVPASDLVPGDMVILEAGNIVPADLRLTEAAQLRIEEAALTGESAPADKTVAPVRGEQVSLGDRCNMVFKGTTVTYGRGAGVVVGTGMHTELGKIATLLQEDEVKTPLQKRMARFGQSLAYLVLGICAIIFTVGILRGEEAMFMFLIAVSLAVAAIPEALPAVITISLALGAKKMVVQNALIRRLPAVETLGSVTYICSDKTGTLTLNRMSVEELYYEDSLVKTSDLPEKTAAPPVIDSSSTALMFTALSISNDAARGDNGELFGDPTEVALYQVAKQYGYDKETLVLQYPRVAEVPFDAERRRMTTIHRDPAGGYISITKGALESILGIAADILSGGAAGPVDREALVKQSESMAQNGLRLLAFAFKKWDFLPVETTPAAVENNLTVIGLAGLLDPPREEAREAVAMCKSAGIKPVMITGDHPATARAIATRLGILDNPGEVMTGVELEDLSDEELKERVGRVTVYARVAPEQKLKIVKALQEKGEYVAMTGDGVNDAPALRRADIGVAMGITGTDVSKEASHMILLDDNFATIVRAVKEGRRIYDNIRKFVRYTMTSNSAEILVIFLAPFLGMPLPLLPIHILWINLVTDGLPGLALAAEKEEKGVMQRPPRHPRESVFAHGMSSHIIWVGLLMCGVSLFSQAWAINTGTGNWQTIVFTVLCLSQMGHVLAIRFDRESFFTAGPFTNKPLLGAVLLTFLLQMAVIYLPALQPVFKTSPLSAGELMFCLALSAVVFIVVEMEKLWLRRRPAAPLITE